MYGLRGAALRQRVDEVLETIGLKHLYVWWRVPYLVPTGIAMGFIYGPMGSLPLTMFFHWLGNLF